MYPHRINLRGPWDVQPLSATRLRRDGSSEALPGPVPPPLKMRLPARWHDAGLPGFQGRVRFRRNFSWPKELASYERLWLVLLGVDWRADVFLNGEPLGSFTGPFLPHEIEITRHVRDRNELTIDVDCPKADPLSAQQFLRRGKLGPGGGLWGTVAVEVRREAFLRMHRVEARLNAGIANIQLEGEVVSETPRGFDLSVRLGDRELAYQPIQPGPFVLELPAGEVARWWPAGLGEPTRHDLLVSLNDVACQLDQHAWAVGFREVHATGDAWVVNGQPMEPAARRDWQEPLLEMASLDQADGEGSLIQLDVPAADGETAARLTAAVMWHPCVVVMEDRSASRRG